jgi:hypothetical protein
VSEENEEKENRIEVLENCLFFCVIVCPYISVNDNDVCIKKFKCENPMFLKIDGEQAEVEAAAEL